MTEIEDLSAEHYRDKQDHLETIRTLKSSLMMYKSIARAMMTKESVETVKDKLYWVD